MRRPSDPFTRPAKAEKRIPFDFVLEALESKSPETRAMFGSTAVYVGERICFILRDKGPGDADAGVWLAFQPEAEAEIAALFPSLTIIEAFRNEVAGWRKLPSRSPDFESDVLRACRLVRAGDRRLGKVPGAKKKKAPAKKAPAKKAARQRPK